MKNKTQKSILSILLALTMIMSTMITTVAEADNASILSASRAATYVIKSDGSLWGFGKDFVGTGGGWDDLEWTPVKILDNVRSVSASDTSRAAVMKDNTLWAWGVLDGLYNGEYGPTYLTPTKILDDVKSVSCSDNYMLVLKTDNSVWVNNFLPGDGTNDSANGFVKVMDNCKYVSAEYDNAYIIKDDDTLWGWGYNTYAELGNRDVEDVYTPIKILDDAKEVHGASATIMCVRLDGSLYAWGSGTNEGIYTENGWVQNAGTPYKVMDNVLTASANYSGSQAAVIKTDGTLWAWGYGNDFIESSVPVKLYDNVRAMSIGGRHIAVVFKDNTLGTAGDNYFQVLGHGVQDNWGENTPLQIVMNSIQDSPAGWAQKEVEEAIGLQLIPNELQGDYEKSITREEFCALAVRLIEVSSDMTINEYISSKSLEIAGTDTFTDTTNPDILAAKTLGITDGYPDGTFKPENQLTREQAAKFLSATARAMGESIDSTVPSYSDAGTIADWAKPYVGYVYDINVMKGVGGNAFAPRNGYQRQQAILTILRLFKSIEA